MTCSTRQNAPTTGARHETRKAGTLDEHAQFYSAGGVSVSGLEMAQNSQRFSWTRDELDSKLQGIMASIHEKCVEHGEEEDYVNYVQGANIAGFVKVADAMMHYGVV